MTADIDKGINLFQLLSMTVTLILLFFFFQAIQQIPEIPASASGLSLWWAGISVTVGYGFAATGIAGAAIVLGTDLRNGGFKRAFRRGGYGVSLASTALFNLSFAYSLASVIAKLQP